MRNHTTNSVSSCDTCQQNKHRTRKFGLLPEKVAEAQPWDKMCCDLIGPYTIRRKGQKDLLCKCVTMIDPATGWFEIHQYDDKRAITVANICTGAYQTHLRLIRLTHTRAIYSVSSTTTSSSSPTTDHELPLILN